MMQNFQQTIKSFFQILLEDLTQMFLEFGGFEVVDWVDGIFVGTGVESEECVDEMFYFDFAKIFIIILFLDCTVFWFDGSSFFYFFRFLNFFINFYFRLIF